MATKPKPKKSKKYDWYIADDITNDWTYKGSEDEAFAFLEQLLTEDGSDPTTLTLYKSVAVGTRRTEIKITKE
jgi:hypothetical protein